VFRLFLRRFFGPPEVTGLHISSGPVHAIITPRLPEAENGWRRSDIAEGPRVRFALAFRGVSRNTAVGVGYGALRGARDGSEIIE
jgi:hypothetical protein